MDVLSSSLPNSFVASLLGGVVTVLVSGRDLGLAIAVGSLTGFFAVAFSCPAAPGQTYKFIRARYPTQSG